MYTITDSIWGRAGTKFDGVLTVNSALEAAGLNWGVTQEKLLIRPDDPWKTGLRPVPGKVANVRDDDDTVLGIVGDGYQVVQNREAFELLEPMLDRGMVELIGAGEFRGGKDVWVQAKFNIEDPKIRSFFEDEGTQPMGLFTNGHGGDRGVGLFQTLIRVICRNTFIMAQASARRSRKLAHTQTVRERLVVAVGELWQDVLEGYAGTVEAYRKLRETRITDAEFKRAVLDVIAPIPNIDPKDENHRKVAVLDRAMAKRNTIRTAWAFGAGHAGDSSAYEAFSGLTEVMDHDEELFGLRTGSKAERAFYGSAREDRKDRVLTNLLALTS